MVLRTLLATSAVVASSAGAFAADLPLRSAPVAPYYEAAPLFTWTGFYAGLNAGAGFGTDQGRVAGNGFTPGNGFVNSPPTGSFGPFRGAGSGAGFVGGGQIGYNYQVGTFVYGIEADIDYFGAGGGGSRTFSDNNVFPAPGSTLTLAQRSGDGFLGTVRGRAGLTLYERTLLYVTGGLAYGDYGPSYSLGRFTSGGLGPLTADFTNGSNGDVRVGYAIGAGVEYAITPHITAKAEYLYTDIGSRNYTLTNPGTGATLNAHSDGEAQMARVGVNYKF